MQKLKKIWGVIVSTIFPMKENRNVPHVLQKEVVVVLLAFVVVLFFFNQNNSGIIRNLNLTGAVYPSVLADLANKDRATLGVQQLTWSPTLQAAAKQKAEDMINNNYFAHTSPAGVTPWYWLSQQNYNFSYAGENLAVDFTESTNVENAWLNSPTHKANIVSDKYTEIGIAAVDGVLQGTNTTVVVEFFGKPANFKTTETTLASNTPTTTPVVTTPQVPQVAGASINNNPKPAVKPVTPKPVPVKVLEENDKFISVQNVSPSALAVANTPTPANVTPEPILAQVEPVAPISHWYSRFAVNPTNTIKIIYNTILGLILISILLMLSKEYEKHHTKHAVMGTMLMGFIGILLFFI